MSSFLQQKVSGSHASSKILDFGPSLIGLIANVTVTTAYSDIPEGCVLFGPRNAHFFTFSDSILTILHSMYLVSNKVASN